MNTIKDTTCRTWKATRMESTWLDTKVQNTPTIHRAAAVIGRAFDFDGDLVCIKGRIVDHADLGRFDLANSHHGLMVGVF